MSTPSEPDLPWLRPTAEVPVQPAAGRRRIVVLLLPVLGLLVLCCGGSALVTTFFRGGFDNGAGPRMVVPSSSAVPSPTESPDPTPSLPPASTSASASLSAQPTTHRPKPTTARPTTTKPRPSAPATSAVIQQGVRPGAFCSPPGAIGLTRQGRVLRCGPSLDDPRDRWRPRLVSPLVTPGSAVRAG